MNVPNITFRREKRERKGRKRVEEREERKKISWSCLICKREMTEEVYPVTSVFFWNEKKYNLLVGPSPTIKTLSSLSFFSQFGRKEIGGSCRCLVCLLLLNFYKKNPNLQWKCWLQFAFCNEYFFFFFNTCNEYFEHTLIRIEFRKKRVVIN